MSLKIEWMNDEKTLFSDNRQVGRSRDGSWFFLSIHVSDRDATITRYCVPGRLDTYSFTFIPCQIGIGDRVTFFSDINCSLARAAKQVKCDLKKKQIVELLKAAKLKCPRSYLDRLLEVL